MVKNSINDKKFFFQILAVGVPFDWNLIPVNTKEFMYLYPQ